MQKLVETSPSLPFTPKTKECVIAKWCAIWSDNEKYVWWYLTDEGFNANNYELDSWNPDITKAHKFKNEEEAATYCLQNIYKGSVASFADAIRKDEIKFLDYGVTANSITQKKCQKSIYDKKRYADKKAALTVDTLDKTPVTAEVDADAADPFDMPDWPEVDI